MPIATPEFLIGSDGVDDALLDNGQPDTTLLDGKGGNDLLKGFGLADVLIGGDGDDTLVGGEGDDMFVFRFVYHEAYDEVIPGTSHQETLTFSLGPPSTNADWKAWEEYEGRLMKFFGGDASVAGSYANLLAQGYTFGANVAALNAAWDAGVGANGPTTLIAGFTKVDLVAPKTSNVKGTDVPKIHDYDNNVTLSGNATGKVFSFLSASDIAGSKIVTVIDSQPTTVHHDAYYSSGDGTDQIDDFQLHSGDNVHLRGVQSEQDFYDNFMVTKDDTGHGITIALDIDDDGVPDAGGWSVHVNMNGLDPQDGINGAVFNDLQGAALEQFAWTYVVDHGEHLAAAPIEFQNYVAIA